MKIITNTHELIICIYNYINLNNSIKFTVSFYILLMLPLYFNYQTLLYYKILYTIPNVSLKI